MGADASGSRAIFARNFAYFREREGKTQKEVAEALNVPASTLNNWATGLKYPRINQIEKLADYFHIRKADLIEENAKEITNIVKCSDCGNSANDPICRENVLFCEHWERFTRSDGFCHEGYRRIER